MALNWMKTLWNGPKEAGDPLRALLNIAATSTQVRIQIENTLIRFNSQVLIRKNGMILIGKPRGLDDHLSAGGHIRLRLPGPERQELRLEVTISHFNLDNGKTAFVCRLPEEMTKCRRGSERYDTMRYSNLRLMADGTLFRLVDFSTRGFKVLLLSTQGPYLFPLGRELSRCQLVLGTDAQIDLQRVIPRNYQASMVGCEYEIRPDETSRRYYEHLIVSIGRPKPARSSAT